MCNKYYPLDILVIVQKKKKKKKNHVGWKVIMEGHCEVHCFSI